MQMSSSNKPPSVPPPPPSNKPPSIPPPSIPPPPPPPRQPSTNLRELRCLGEGAQARVYLVEHAESGERSCVKRVTTSSPKAAEQALQEVAILSRLSHPSITRIFGAWQTASPPTLHILMEYADGGTLADAIRARRDSPTGFDEAIVMEHVGQIASALAYLHGLSILHRDLKTANVFLTARNLVKVGDFGIAKVLEANGSLARTAVGTPYYLAPELVSGEPYAFKADMWALGVLLYELLALHRPFEASTLPALALKIVKCEYAPPPHAANYSADVLSLLNALLRREPSGRPSAQQICDAPITRKYHARLHAQLRSLAVHAQALEAALPTAVDAATDEEEAEAADKREEAVVAAAEAIELIKSPGAGGGQGARAAACALRVQSMLGAEATTLTPSAAAAAAYSSEPSAVACASTTAVTPTSVEANMRFSQNLMALEANLANMEQMGALPEPGPRRSAATFASPPFSAVLSPSVSVNAPSPAFVEATKKKRASGGV